MHSQTLLRQNARRWGYGEALQVGFQLFDQLKDARGGIAGVGRLIHTRLEGALSTQKA